MKNDILCPQCGNKLFIYDSLCPICNQVVNKSIESTIINQNATSETQISSLPLGESVIIVNEEHPYHNEIALICAKKHLHVRIELHGKRIWMPNDWVKKYDDS